MADIQQVDLKQNVDGHDGIWSVRGGGMERGWNGIHYKQGLSGKNVAAKNLSINVATIPSGGVAYAHIHVGFEVRLYIVQRHVRDGDGPGTECRDPGAGDSAGRAGAAARGLAGSTPPTGQRALRTGGPVPIPGSSPTHPKRGRRRSQCRLYRCVDEHGLRGPIGQARAGFCSVPGE